MTHTSTTQQLLGQADAQPVLDLAAHHAREGWSAFTASVAVERAVTGLGGRADVVTFDIGPLIRAVEDLGWRLDVLNHVAVEISSGHTQTRGHMLFRRVG